MVCYLMQARFDSIEDLRARFRCTSPNQGHPCTRWLRGKAAGPITKFKML